MKRIVSEPLLLECAEGFTLIELMIVVAIIGILASVAIPKFSQLIAKSHESTTKGNLGTIRSALSIYYSDTEGQFPGDDLTSMLVGNKFIDEIPGSTLPMTQNSVGHGGPYTGVLNGHIPDGSDDVASNDGWLYDNGGAASDTWGRIIVNCTHNDAHGQLWTSF